jgi:hypothetical protein
MLFSHHVNASSHRRMTEIRHQRPARSSGVRRFQVVATRDGYRWELFNPSGTVVVRSAETYPTKDAAKEAARHEQTEISRAPILPCS